MSRDTQVFEFKKEFDFLTKKIENKQHMAFVRWGDGEYFLLKESNLFPVSHDKWKWKGGPSKTKTEILKSFDLQEPEFYHGITCEEWSFRYDNEAMNYFLQKIKQPIEYITYASLFIDDNYKYFRSWFETLHDHDIIFVMNKCCAHPFGKSASEAETHYLPDDLVNLFETEGDTMVAKYKAIAKQHTNRVFFFAGGPVAKVLIYHMWLTNPKNTYIDVGSAIDMYTKGKKTRLYQHDTSKETVRKGREFTRRANGVVRFL
jgi:hypothetical protein